METRHLDAKGKGEMDYDSIHDILFFKIKKRAYHHSIEFEDIVLDVDREGFITGIQLFGASTIFNIEKDALQNLKKWEFSIRTEGKMISIQIMFETVRRNKIVERGQNLIRETTAPLADAEVQCAVT